MDSAARTPSGMYPLSRALTPRHPTHSTTLTTWPSGNPSLPPAPTGTPPPPSPCRSNALLNSIPNAEFIASKAEAATRRVLSRLSAAERESLVAVVDPPRAGLHNDVIKALRGCLPLKRILFVSCHAPAFVRNAVGFCRPPSRAFEGEPFTPTRAFAVDLFPDTEHCELVVLLERQGSAQSKPDETAECQASAQPKPTDAPGGEPPAPELMPGVDGQQPVTEEGEPSAEVGRVSAEGDAEPVEGLHDS